MDTTSPKSLASWIALGREMAGTAFSKHVEHFRSLIACTISSGHPSCLQKVANFWAPGWPRFLWIFSSHACVSGFKAINLGPCFCEARSITDRSGLGKASEFIGISSGWPCRARLASGNAASGTSWTGDKSAEEEVWEARISESLCSGSLDVAKMVRLTLAGTPLRLNPLKVNLSHASHSSSTSMSSWRRRMHILFLGGATPFGMVLVGPTYLSVPRQRTRWTTRWSGHICCTFSTKVPFSNTKGPTRGAVSSAISITVCQLTRTKRWAMSAGLSLDRNLLFLVGWSEASSWGGSARMAYMGCSLCMLWSKTRATCRANFLGYHSVKVDKATLWPLKVVLPAIWRCSCSLEHMRPWMATNRAWDVVRTRKRFRMGMCVSGSVRSPTLHKSKQHSWVPAWISCKLGWFSMWDPSGCSRWKCFWRLDWYWYSTTAKAICHRLARRFPIPSARPCNDFPMLNWDHFPQGPHSGLYQTCSGV